MVQTDSTSPAVSSIEAISQVVYGFMYMQMLHVAVKLGIPDFLVGGPKGAEELARASGSHPRALYRILRALCDTGLLAESEDHNFALTSKSQALRSDVPFSVRAMVLAYGSQPWLTDHSPGGMPGAISWRQPAPASAPSRSLTAWALLTMTGSTRNRGKWSVNT
jgi:hypothetical protein